MITNKYECRHCGSGTVGQAGSQWTFMHMRQRRPTGRSCCIVKRSNTVCTVLGSDRRSEFNRRQHFSFSSLLSFRSPIWTYNYPYSIWWRSPVTRCCNDVMAAILKVYNATSEMRNPTPSVDAYLGLYSKKSEEQSRQFHPDPVWNDRGLELDYAWRRSLQQQEEQEQAAIYEISFWSSNYKTATHCLSIRWFECYRQASSSDSHGI